MGIRQISLDSIDLSQISEQTTAQLILRDTQAGKIVTVDLNYSDSNSICLLEAPVQAETLITARDLLEHLAVKYGVPAYDESVPELIRFPVKVEWVNMDEGLQGDYNADDPEDINLLRFDVSVFRDGEWVAKDDASYCTMFPADASPALQRRGLVALMSHFHDALAHDIDVSVKKLGEELSWISSDDFPTFVLCMAATEEEYQNSIPSGVYELNTLEDCKAECTRLREEARTAGADDYYGAYVVAADGSNPWQEIFAPPSQEKNHPEPDADLMKSLNEILGSEKKFRYMMLSRMKSDCDYYLGYGKRCSKHLWAGNEQDHLFCMKAIWESFTPNDKPEWLTSEELQSYEHRMLHCSLEERIQTSRAIPGKESKQENKPRSAER